MLEAHTVKAVAEQLERPLNAVHHRVRQFERLGLLRVEKLEARQGRPIKHYRTSAKGFFVPFTATNADGLGGFLREQLMPFMHDFVEQLARAGSGMVKNIQEVGFRVYDAGGFVNADVSPQGYGFDFFRQLLAPEAPAIMLSLYPLRLSTEDSKALQQEMVDLLIKYGARSGPENHLALLGLVPQK